MTESGSLFGMMEAHHELDGLFREYQLALVGKDTARSLSFLARFRWELLQHMEEEERCVLPLFEQRCGELPGGRREIFELEHAKIRTNLDRLMDKGLEVLPATGTPTSGQVLDLIDRAWPFKQLLQHHERREASILYPALDRSLDDPARCDFWQSISGLRRERCRHRSRWSCVVEIPEFGQGL